MARGAGSRRPARSAGHAWRRGLAALPLLCALLGACRSASSAGAERAERSHGPIRPLAPGETGHAIYCGKVLTVDERDRTFAPGMVVVRDGKIERVGPPEEVPAGFIRHDYPGGWCTPGLIDLHSHVQTGGWGDINDMVLPLNTGFRTSPTIVPGNANVRRACAGGVTTLFGIPGSGTSISGFGVLYKTKWDTTYEGAVLADPGGMKVAQDSNPQRGSGDLGATRAGLGWMLERINDRARAAAAPGEPRRRDPLLADLERVHRGELPVLIHTAGSEGAANTARMWRKRYPVRSVLSHGCFDAWKVAPAVAASGIPVNNGPRVFDYGPSRESRIVGFTAEYIAAGSPLISMNTDAGVMPQEELFLQGAMASRYGADRYTMLRAVTIHPAKAFGIDDRVGSIELGKDADLVVFAGPPLDSRSPVEIVLIDGRVEYDRARDGQKF
jgi:imidazolonepropionase-like amidohydrolase